MGTLKYLGNVAKALGETMLETIAESDSDTPKEDPWEHMDSFDNSARVNVDGDIVTDLEGKNASENGGYWIRLQ